MLFLVSLLSIIIILPCSICEIITKAEEICSSLEIDEDFINSWHFLE